MLRSACSSGSADSGCLRGNDSSSSSFWLGATIFGSDELAPLRPVTPFLSFLSEEPLRRTHAVVLRRACTIHGHPTADRAASAGNFPAIPLHEPIPITQFPCNKRRVCVSPGRPTLVFLCPGLTTGSGWSHGCRRHVSKHIVSKQN